MTGAELRAYRKAAGLTQAELAQRTGIGRQTVIYWEKKPLIDPWGWAPRRMLEVMGVRGVMSFSETTTPARGDGVLLWNDPYIAKLLARERERLTLKAQAQAARRRVLCGARTRKGHDCKLMSEPGRTRCKFHGGMSTGPRTPEGRAKIAEAQRRRWAQRAAEIEQIQVRSEIETLMGQVRSTPDQHRSGEDVHIAGPDA